MRCHFNIVARQYECRPLSYEHRFHFLLNNEILNMVPNTISDFGLILLQDFNGNICLYNLFSF